MSQLFYPVVTASPYPPLMMLWTKDALNTWTHNVGGGRVVRWCWVNFQCRGVVLIWIIVGQGPIALAVGVGGGCLDIFSLVYHFSFLSPSLWETAQYRLKYCLKGPLSPKTTNQQPTMSAGILDLHSATRLCQYLAMHLISRCLCKCNLRLNHMVHHPSPPYTKLHVPKNIDGTVFHNVNS